MLVFLCFLLLLNPCVIAVSGGVSELPVTAAKQESAFPTAAKGPEEPAGSDSEKIYPLPRVYIEDGSIYYVKDYEPVTVRVVDEYGRTVTEDTDAQWRSHGNATASKPKRPYKLKLSSSQSLLGMDSSRRYVLLASDFDKSLLRNALALELGQALGIPYTSGLRFVDVYLSGSPRGNYLMVEAVHIGRNQVNIHPAAGEYLLEAMMGHRRSEGVTIHTPVMNYIFEVSSVDSLDSEEERELLSFLEKAENALLSHDREQIEEYFDTDSFLSTYLLNEFSKNPDTAFASSRFYIKGGKLYAGPPWDFDLAFGDAKNPSSDKLHWNNLNCAPQVSGWYATTLWWHELVKTDWFQLRFRDLYLDSQSLLVNLYEDNALGKNRLDAMAEDMRESIETNYSVWNIKEIHSSVERSPESGYEGNLEFLRGWLKQRNEWILSQLNGDRDFITLRE